MNEMNISSGSASEAQIADTLRQWHARLKVDPTIHPNIDEFVQKNSWSQAAEKLICHITAVDSEIVTT